jgi:CheY-like chemotaxis protein
MLFEKFTQADASTTRKYGGTGLGLTISKQLIERMGGCIGAGSRVASGSTFWFELSLPLDPEALSSQEPLEAAAQELKDLRVLIVDDNDVNRRVLEAQVQNWGIRHGAVASGEAALAELRSAEREGDPYRIVATDYQMPAMDGLGLAEAIKNDPLLRNVAVVILSSIGNLSEVRRMETAARISACLVKPVRAAQLRQILLKVGAPQPFQTASPLAGLLTMERQVRTEAPATKDARLTGPPARVLVAEDNVVNQRVAVRMLERFGLRVDVAANGREALEMFALLPYDLVFMDCQMPEVNGYEASAAIRRREAPGRRVTIVAMTAEALTGSREQCLKAGMDDFVSKPVTLGNLAAVLDKWGVKRQPAPADVEPAARV